MNCADKISLLALAVNLFILTPFAVWLSYSFAVRQFKTEQIETKVDLFCESQRQLDHDLTFYCRLLKTFGGSEFLAGLTAAEPLSDPEDLFDKIYQTGIHDDIVKDVTRLRELGFYILLENRDPIAHDALLNFRLNQETLTSAEKGQLIGTCFLKNDVKTRLASISRDEIRSFVKSLR